MCTRASKNMISKWCSRIKTLFAEPMRTDPELLNHKKLYPPTISIVDKTTPNADGRVREFKLKDEQEALEVVLTNYLNLSAMESGVVVYPAFALFNYNGDSSTHSLINHTDDKIAYKITFENESGYVSSTANGVIDPNSSIILTLTRRGNDDDTSLMKIVYGTASHHSTDAEEAFESLEDWGTVVLRLSAFVARH